MSDLACLGCPTWIWHWQWGHIICTDDGPKLGALTYWTMTGWPWLGMGPDCCALGGLGAAKPPAPKENIQTLTSGGVDIFPASPFTCPLTVWRCLSDRLFVRRRGVHGLGLIRCWRWGRGLVFHDWNSSLTKTWPKRIVQPLDALDSRWLLYIYDESESELGAARLSLDRYSLAIYI